MTGGAVPPDFLAADMQGFVGLNGGFLRREQGEQVSFGFVAQDRHCNPFGLVHGGWLSTLADLQMLMQAAHGSGLPTAKLVTVSLSVNYLGAARAGDWVESRAVIARQTRTLVFVEGRAFTPARPVIGMNGIYQIRQD